ncbi:MAG: hypothetical protein RLZZ474_591 [Bacteroidota bacterium]
MLLNLIQISWSEMISLFNFVSIVVGFLALGDFLIRFKRPRHIKIFFSLFLFSLLFLDSLLWIEVSFQVLVAWSPIINFGIWVTGLFTLSILTVGRISRWVWWSSALIFLLNCYNYSVLMDLDGVVFDRRSIFMLRGPGSFSFVQLGRYGQRIILLISIIKLARVIFSIQAERNLYWTRLKRWLTIMITVASVVIFCNNIVAIWVFKTPYFFEFSLCVYVFFCLSTFLLVLYRPEFLNNHNVSKLDFKRYMRAIDLQLTDANFFVPFFQDMYYLNSRATIDHFCKHYGIAEFDQFNEQIIQRYQMSFSQLINQKRIEYFVSLAKDPNYAHYSIEALAKESGFNSRTALYKPFKKFHGGTPIDLIHALSK